MFGDVVHNNAQYKHPVITATPKPVLSRYFIELHVTVPADAPRLLADQLRRNEAVQFIHVLEDWLADQGLRDEVSNLTITVMGQVMVLCSHRVIDLIREQDIWAIAHIRSSDQVTGWQSLGGRA